MMAKESVVQQRLKRLSELVDSNSALAELLKNLPPQGSVSAASQGFKMPYSSSFDLGTSKEEAVPGQKSD